MNGVVYCRVSSKEQIEGTSLESQEAACREYARQHHIEIAKVFVEQGESAKFADRTQLLELLDFCHKQKGKVEVLLVWKLDRFARSVADHYSVKASLAKYGVQVVSVTEPIDAKPEGKLLESILAGFAEFDNDIRAMRTVQGMRRKIQEGIFPWGPPLGYKSSVNGKEKKNAPDVPDQPKFGILQRAWKLFATGGYTQAEMGNLLTSWGLATARGQEIGPQSIFQLFTNPYYAGIIVDPWDGGEYEGQHIPMVTKEQFAIVQGVIKGRNRSISHQKEREEFPLRGFVRCKACHHPLTAAFSRGRNRRYPYYVCHGDACSEKTNYRADDIHTEFDKFLDAVAPKAEFFEKFSDFVLGRGAERQRDYAVREKRRRDRIAAIDRQMQEIIKMRSEHLLTDAEFLRQKQVLGSQRAALEVRSEAFKIEPEKLRGQIQTITAPLVNLRATWHALKLRRRRRFERLILPAGFIAGESRTAELGLLFKFFCRSATTNSYVVHPVVPESNLIIQEIQAFLDVLFGPEEEIAPREPRFEHSRINRPRMT